MRRCPLICYRFPACYITLGGFRGLGYRYLYHSFQFPPGLFIVLDARARLRLLCPADESFSFSISVLFDHPPRCFLHFSTLTRRTSSRPQPAELASSKPPPRFALTFVWLSAQIWPGYHGEEKKRKGWVLVEENGGRRNDGIFCSRSFRGVGDLWWDEIEKNVD